MADRKTGTQAKKSTRSQRYAKEPAGKRKPARAKRNDTGEAKPQRQRASKTHPTRAAGAQRKDKGTGAAAPPGRTRSQAGPRVPSKKTRPAPARTASRGRSKTA